ncbi:hypothetical protein BJ878DRAFT_511372 [Calycina marina]|uniref:Uncharacterized protein n=1 Tax=Calycina marina TaxID=1763456 RepID=A0A9P8CE18_9HELO|nr:hypothetical protein BJ878DRAFT_511372 [Calycina marina]
MLTQVNITRIAAQSTRLSSTSANLYPLLKSMSSPDILAEIVGSSGKSTEFFEEIQDVATKLLSTQKVKEQQFAQGTILEQRIIELGSRIEAEESQYIALEKVWKDNQDCHALVVSTLNDTIAHLQNYSATDSITPRVSTKPPDSRSLSLTALAVALFGHSCSTSMQKFNNNASEFPDM